MFTFSNALAQLHKNEQGNMAVMFALGGGIISLIAAVSLDTAQLTSTKSKMQDALDTATIYYSQNIDSDTVEEDAEGLFLTNFMDSLNVSNLTVNFEVSGDDVMGMARASKPLLFGELLGMPMSGISTATTVKLNLVAEETACIMALNPSAQPGITLNSGAEVQTMDCEAHVHANRNSSFSINSGVTWDVDRTCVAGSRITNNTGSSLNIETDCEVAPDPYAGAFPEPSSNSCDFNNGNFNSANITMEPGVYCGWHNFNNSNSEVTFEPGTYVIRGGGWNVNGGTWEGDGVTFYFADTSRIQFNSGVSADMTPPTSGDYKDVFITEAPGLNASDFTINGTNGFAFEGILYLPSRRVIFNSGAAANVREVALVAGSFIFNDANINIEGVGGSGSSGGSVTTPYISE